MLNLKILKKKIKSLFVIYTDFESILVAEDNGKQNPKESLKYQNIKNMLLVVIYLVCVNDKFSNPFKSYLGEDAVYNFISSMIKESKYCSDMMKKNLTKNL